MADEANLWDLIARLGDDSEGVCLRGREEISRRDQSAQALKELGCQLSGLG